MDLLKYNEIVSKVQCFDDPREYLNHLTIIYPGIKRQTLLCIYDQLFQRKMKTTYRKHNAPEKTNEYYFRYCENSQQNVCDQVILTMAKQEGLSPSLMARIILERHLAFTKYKGTRAPQGEVSDLLKKPWMISDVTLMKEIQFCTFTDLLYGPISDKRKQSLGHEHEAILKIKLNQAGIPFQDETHLQTKGFDKTPDIVLQVPIAIDGDVITWIESKASFGDEELHQGYLRDQYWCYQNRFGPGLVIYWFGYLKDLDVNKKDGIMMADKFPEQFEVFDAE